MAKENKEIGDIVKKCKILLLDIEGTTTSISFVKVGLNDWPAGVLLQHVFIIFRILLLSTMPVVQSYGKVKISGCRNMQNGRFLGFAIWRTNSKWYPFRATYSHLCKYFGYIQIESTWRFTWCFILLQSTGYCIGFDVISLLESLIIWRQNYISIHCSCTLSSTIFLKLLLFLDIVVIG